MFKKIILTLFIAIISTHSFSYDKTGHRIIGQIAQLNLTKTAKLRLKKLLGDKTLDEVSNWPDEIKSDPLLARPQNTWHYVNIKGGKYIPLDPGQTYEKLFRKYPKLTYETIQKTKSPKYSKLKGNLIWAIKKFQLILKNKKNTKKQRAEAVKFLVHLIGDLHQPLHCGYAHDRGGNSVEVTWNGRDTNLHTVWDSKMIKMSQLSFSEYVKYIYKKKEIKFKKIKNSSLMDWVKESMSVRDSLYELVKKKRYEGKYKEYKYHYDFKSLLNQNLIKGGIRLAKVLNANL